jgi:hypothetical protein
MVLSWVGLQFLVSAGLYESQEEAVQREEVLGRLDQVREKSLSSTSDDEPEAGGNCVELYQKSFS